MSRPAQTHDNGPENSFSGSRVQDVNTHLRNLADRILAQVSDLSRVRALIDEYSHVDPVNKEVESDVVIPSDAPTRGEWLVPNNVLPGHRLMYVHGGSWMSGSLSGYRAHASRIAQATRCAVFNVDYRLAPESAFPCGLEDCDSAMDWMRDHGPDGASGARSIIAAGDSAGGNLILALLLMRRAQKKFLPDAAIALSPATDLTWQSASIEERAPMDPILRPERLHGAVHAYLQRNSTAENPLVSPLLGDLHALPPVMLQVGEAEVLLDDSTRYACKAARAGVHVNLEVWPQMPHVFQMFSPYLPQASLALNSIGNFVTNTLSAKSGKIEGQ